MKGSSFPQLVVTGRRLRSLPAIREALESGEVGWSQAMLLCRHANPDNEKKLLDLVHDQTVRQLARALAALDRQDGDPSGPDDPQAVDHTAEVSPDPAQPLPEPWGTLKLRAPQQLLLKFDFFPDFVRKLEGRVVLPPAAVEILAQEISSMALAGQISPLAEWKTPPIDTPTVAEPMSAGAAPVGDARAVDGPDQPKAASDSRWLRELYLMLYDPGFLLRDPDPDNPLDLVGRLIKLRNLMQQLHAILAHQLRQARERGLHRALGFPSFETFCEVRLGISKSKAFMLLAADRELRKCPLVYECWRQGRLSLVQVSALARVANRHNEVEWIQIALCHPVVFLLRLVRYVAALATSDPEFHARLRGLPPAEMTSGRFAFRELQMSEPTAAGTPAPLAAETMMSAPLAVASGTIWPASVPARLSSAIEPNALLVLRGPIWALEVIRDAILKLISAAKVDLQPWQAFEALLDDFLATHSTLDRRPTKAQVRDDFHCQTPGCSCSRIEEHHVLFRSRGGHNRASNRTWLCPAHHRHGIHDGRLTVTGRAPDRLRWEFRLKPGDRPYARYHGQLRVYPRPLAVDGVRAMFYR